jgi:ribosomal-protein-alanine N-acetyltransferase
MSASTSLMARVAEDRDLPSLLEIIAPYFSPGFHWSPDVFRTEFENTETWVLDNGSQIVAFCCLRDVVDAWEISVVATRSSEQGKGYMQALFRELFRQNGRRRHYWLEVHEKNVSAQKLYEKIGFQRDGSRGGYYSDGSTAFLYSLARKP